MENNCFIEEPMICTNQKREIKKPLDGFMFPEEWCEYHAFSIDMLSFAIATNLPRKCKNCTYYKNAFNHMKR